MTVSDEARELHEDERRAADDLTAVRREIEETVAAGGGHIGPEAAAEFGRRLEAAQERVRRARIARRELGGATQA